MRQYSIDTAAAFAATGLVARTLFWVRARDRATNAEEALGLWTGDDHQEFTIGGVERTYYGAGGVVAIDPIVMTSGLTVRSQRAEFSPLAPEVMEMVRTYEPRFAPVEIHRALFDPDTMNLVDEPHRVFRGWIDGIRVDTPAVGGSGRIELSLVSTARALTRTLAAKKSDETQRRRSNDRFRRYADVSGSVDVWWGETRGRIGAAPIADPRKVGSINWMRGS